MPSSQILNVSLALLEGLKANIPALVTEINQLVQPSYQVELPREYMLGIRTDMLKRAHNELPVLACGVYVRQQEHELEQLESASSVFMPFIIEVYMAGHEATALYIQATKWAMVLDLFVERYGSILVGGFVCDEAPDIDISYVLEGRGNELRQLVSAAAIFVGME